MESTLSNPWNYSKMEYLQTDLPAGDQSSLLLEGSKV